MNKILITCYEDSDLDGAACGVAYEEFLNKKGIPAEAGFFGSFQEEVKFVFEKFGFDFPLKNPKAENYEKVILVDASELIAIGNRFSPEKVVEIIDHRMSNDAEKFSNAGIQIEKVGAAATLIAEKFRNENIIPSQKSAILLAAAIISNTLNFKGGVTTERDKNISSWLNEFSGLAPDFSVEMFKAKSDLSGKKLFEQLEIDLAKFVFGKNKLGIAQIEMVGSRELVKNRIVEIVQGLKILKNKKKLDFIFLNIIDLEKYFNFFIASDLETQNILEKIFNVKFKNKYSTYPKLIMRKEIVPLLKKELEKKF